MASRLDSPKFSMADPHRSRRSRAAMRSSARPFPSPPEVDGHARAFEAHARTGDGDPPAADQTKRRAEPSRAWHSSPRRRSTPRLEHRRDRRIEGAVGRDREPPRERENPSRIAGPRVQPADAGIGSMPAHDVFTDARGLENRRDVTRVHVGLADRQGGGAQRPHTRPNVRPSGRGGHARVPATFSTAIAFRAARPVASTDNVAPEMLRTSRYGTSGSASVLRAYCFRKRRSRTSPP